MTTLLRDLAECADEIGACGAGNEAAVVRKAMAEITSLRAQLDEARRENKVIIIERDAAQMSNDLLKASEKALSDRDIKWGREVLDLRAQLDEARLERDAYKRDAAKTLEQLGKGLDDQIDAVRAAAIEDCAAIADERAAICADAVAKIKAGELYKETAKTSVQTENCARLEALHIAELIRALLSESKT